MNKSTAPHGPLGKKLRKMRLQKNESLAEVAGAVEIDIETMHQFEQGLLCPNEEIINLLISHFDLHEDEADVLLRLAGIDLPAVEQAVQDNSDRPAIAALTPEDLKIVYTDSVVVTANRFGVIVNFLQSGGPGGQPLAISRVGMSRDHAMQMLEVLSQALNRQPAELPAESSDSNSN